MGRAVFKEAPDIDYYVVWSSNSDGPVFSGTREELLPWLWDADDRKPDRIEEWDPGHPDGMVQRADETGTSVKYRIAAGPFTGAWDDDEMTYMGATRQTQGSITRANIFVLAHRLDEDNDADLTDLVEPFDD